MKNQNSWLDDYDKDKGWTGGQKSLWGEGKRCYHSHPALKIGKFEVFGGSCGNPIHDDADVYVGLDWSMKQHKQRFPWEPGEAIHFEIKDGHAPSNAKEFFELIDYLEIQINDGKKVHAGCIGGHGRTGIVLSALVAQMTGLEDPINYVRTHYCKKVVESKEQVDFLVEQYGCKDVGPSKVYTTSKKFTKSKGQTKKDWATVAPVKAKHSIFGDLKVEK
jgi:hypothetical protein